MVGDRVPSDPEECCDCGYDELNCRCDDEDFMDELDCTYCGGDGTGIGDDPGWDFGEIIPCFACKGTGKRRDQWFF